VLVDHNFLSQDNLCPEITIALVSPIISVNTEASPPQAVMNAAISILEYSPQYRL
jgi:hypothetical protein